MIIFARQLYREGIRVKFVYEGHRFKIKVTGAKRTKFLFPQCKTSIGNNFGSTEYRAVQFACSMGFLVTAERMEWPPSLSRDWKWPCVTINARIRELLLLPYIRRKSFCHMLRIVLLKISITMDHDGVMSLQFYAAFTWVVSNPAFFSSGRNTAFLKSDGTCFGDSWKLL